MKQSDRRLIAVELAILVLAQLVLDGTAAFAGSCSNAEQIFIRAAQSPSDSSPVYAYGTRSRITMRNRDLDPACPAAYPPDSTGFYGAVSLSTAHINRGITGSYAGYQVEIGWVEVWEGNDTSGQGAGLKDWYVFSEKQANWDIKDITTQLSFNLDPGNDDWWRASAVAKPNGTTDWKLAVNFLIGQGWVDFKTYNTEWDFGVPMGETERKGTDTGMMDYQYNLDLKLSNGDWASWADVRCNTHPDSLPDENWWWRDLSTDSYEVINTAARYC